MYVEKVAYAIRKLREINGRLNPWEFDIGCWGVRDPDCGTIACAVGHLAMDREAAEYLGLTTIWESGDTFDVIMGQPNTERLRLVEDSVPVKGSHKLTSVFGLASKDIEDTFHACGYPQSPNQQITLQDVIDRLTLVYLQRDGDPELIAYEALDLEVQQLVDRALRPLQLVYNAATHG